MPTYADSYVNVARIDASSNWRDSSIIHKFQGNFKTNRTRKKKKKSTKPTKMKNYRLKKLKKFKIKSCFAGQSDK